MYHNFILSNQSKLTPEFCEHVINKFEHDSNKHVGLISNSIVNKTIKKSTDLNITGFPEWTQEDQVFKKALDSAINDYKNLLVKTNQHLYPFHDCTKNVKDSGFQIQRTMPGEYYDWHTDERIYSVTDQATRTIKTYVRGLTYIFYLNDVSEGGYTEFVDGTKIQPKQCQYLIFPDTWTHVHRGYPPMSETKYIVTGWLSGCKVTSIDSAPPPESEKRDMANRITNRA